MPALAQNPESWDFFARNFNTLHTFLVCQKRERESWSIILHWFPHYHCVAFYLPCSIQIFRVFFFCCRCCFSFYLSNILPALRSYPYHLVVLFCHTTQCVQLQMSAWIIRIQFNTQFIFPTISRVCMLMFDLRLKQNTIVWMIHLLWKPRVALFDKITSEFFRESISLFYRKYFKFWSIFNQFVSARKF